MSRAERAKLSLPERRASPFLRYTTFTAPRLPPVIETRHRVYPSKKRASNNNNNNKNNSLPSNDHLFSQQRDILLVSFIYDVLPILSRNLSLDTRFPRIHIIPRASSLLSLYLFRDKVREGNKDKGKNGSKICKRCS